MPEEPGISSATRVFARVASQGACTSLSSCEADQASSELDWAQVMPKKPLI